MGKEPFLPGYLLGLPYGIAVTKWKDGNTSDTPGQSPPLLPSRLNELDCAPTIAVLNNGMEVAFGEAHTGTDRDVGSVRSNNVIPVSCGIYYFEAEILSAGEHGYRFI